MNINCKNCGNKINENAKFCTHCGTKIQDQSDLIVEEKSDTKKTKLQPQPKLNDNLEKICDHLEFLGYKLDKIKAKDSKEKDLVIATHTQKNNVIIIPISPTMALFKISLTTKKKHIPAMDAFVNEANKALVFAKMYTELDADSKEAVIVLEAMYTSEYNKETFAEFFECFNTDANPRLFRLPGCDELFLDK